MHERSWFSAFKRSEMFPTRNYTYPVEIMIANKRGKSVDPPQLGSAFAFFSTMVLGLSKRRDIKGNEDVV